MACGENADGQAVVVFEGLSSRQGAYQPLRHMEVVSFHFPFNLTSADGDEAFPVHRRRL